MFLKNKNIIFKTRRSKVTDYAALNVVRTVIQPATVAFSARGKIGTFTDFLVAKKSDTV